MRKLLLLFGGFALLLVGAGLLTTQHTLKSPVSRESCEKIQPGMAVGEVERLLGRPADLTMPRPCPEMPAFSTTERCCRLWFGPDGGIRVEFDQSGQVMSAEFDLDLVRVTEPFLDKLRGRLGL